MKRILAVCRYFSMPFSIIFFLFGIIWNVTLFMNIGILLLWASTFLFALDELEERIFFAAFLITFFTFLLGRTVAQMIYDFTNYHIFSDSIVIHTNICIYLALLSLYLIFSLICQYSFSIGGLKIGQSFQEDDNERYYSIEYESVRKASKLLYYFTFPFSVLIAVEKAIFVAASGYSEYYVSYASRFPYAFTKLADVCTVCFFIFLATMPSKKDTKFPILLYAVSAVLGLFGGKRSELVVPVLIIILYFYIRNTINPGETKWLKGRHVLIIAVLTPFLFAGLYFFNYYRFGTTTEVVSIPKMVAGFFDNLGFSANVISYEKLYEAQIPEKLYSFGDTIDYLRENVLTQLFFDFPVYKTQTVEKALNGNNFTQTITYLYSAKYYLAGRGLGSSYIAEAYHDFGYLGIVLWSGIYCFVLKNLYSFKNRSIIYNTMAFCALKYILLAPRTMASAFISEIINVNTWLVIIVVFLVAKILRGVST